MDPESSSSLRPAALGGGGPTALGDAEREALERLLRAGVAELRRAARSLDEAQRPEAARWIRELERGFIRALPRIVSATDRAAALDPLRSLVARSVDGLRAVFGDRPGAGVVDAFARRIGDALDALVRPAPDARPGPAATSERVEISARAAALLAESEAPVSAPAPGDPLAGLLQRVLALFAPAAPWRQRLRRGLRRRVRPRPPRRSDERAQAEEAPGTGDTSPPPRTS